MVTKKNNIWGGLPKKGLGQFAKLRWGLAKKMGIVVVFLRGVDTPVHTMYIDTKNGLHLYMCGKDI